MARTALTTTRLGGAYATTGTVITESAADVSNGNKIAFSEGDIVLARNTDSGSHTVTITSVANDLGRSGSIVAESLAAGAIKAYGPFKFAGWRQTSDGSLYVAASDATVKFSILRP